MDPSSFFPDLGPLSIVFSWQSIVLALVVATTTHGLKTILDIKMGGAEKRSKNLWINRLVLPATPIILGALAAIFIPLHPEALLTYLKDNAIVGGKAISILAAYGICLGQFSDYVWHRVSGVTKDVRKPKKELGAGPVPKELPAETPPADPSKGP